MASRRITHTPIERIRQPTDEGATSGEKNAKAIAQPRTRPFKGGILAALRRWPIAELNLKRERVKPRKIDL